MKNIGRNITSAEALCAMVDKYGFLPLFKNNIEGFSVEEHTPPRLWFAPDVDGPWEWKGPVIRMAGCAYGKFFKGKAGFISMKWFPDFANYRRDGYDFDARFDDGLARYSDKVIFDALYGSGDMLSRLWRQKSGVKKRGEFDAAVNRLQMLCYVTTTDFEYAVDKNGSPYGWGLARYSTPEEHFGSAFTDKVYQKEPEDSLEIILKHLQGIFPDEDEKQLMRIIKA